MSSRTPGRARPRRWVGIGAIVGLVRAAAVILGVSLLDSSGPLQPVGYGLTLAGLPEIVLVRGLVGEGLIWRIAAATVTVAGTFVWAYLIERLIRLRRSRGP